MTQVFSGKFHELFKNTFFIEYLRAAASEIVTENSPGNSARNKKFHIIQFFSTRLTKLEFSARAQNLHVINPVDV